MYEQISADTLKELFKIWKVKNIYDLAGNLQEWTLETANTNEKICRGSNYDVSGSPCMVSGYSTAVTATENDTGYRLMLYIIKE